MFTEFINEFTKLLGSEVEEFKKAFNKKAHRGLRINPGKINETNLFNRYGDLEKVPWCGEGYYLPDDLFLGRDSWHVAGAFYLQEPSAMLPVEILDPKPGEVVLDLAAAPGGKSTQILSKLQGKGVLVSNEINSGRTKALMENLERWGYENYLVLNENPNRLLDVFSSFFDRILVDAPCSGEGMFRKNPEALKEWSRAHVAGCSVRQEKLLNTAAKLLKEGGVLVYSTCTFNPEENEKVIANFLKQNSGFSLEEVKIKGVSAGIPAWADDNPELAKTYRIWPHRQRGEGHFAARMVKTSGSNLSLDKKPVKKQIYNPKEVPKEFYQFWQQYYNLPNPEVVLKGEKVYLLPKASLGINNIRIVKAGVYMGEIKKGRFLPSQELAWNLISKNFRQKLELSEDLLKAYLRGESFSLSLPDGWYLVVDGGISLGFGYVKKGIFKNQLGKNLRGLIL